MKILQSAFVLLGCATAFLSCQKDGITTLEPSVLNPNPAVNKCDYSPYSVGSTFTFELATKNIQANKWSFAENKGSMTRLLDTLTQKYSVGVGFFPQDTSVKKTESFIRCDAMGLYVLAKGINNGKDMELPMLQYPLTVGKTWKSAVVTTTFSGGNSTFYYEYKVIKTGTSRLVKATTFTDVAEIQESIVLSTQYTGSPAISQTSTYSRFYDKKAGVIETIFFYQNPFLPNVKDTSMVQKLVLYNIK